MDTRNLDYGSPPLFLFKSCSRRVKASFGAPGLGLEFLALAVDFGFSSRHVQLLPF